MTENNRLPRTEPAGGKIPRRRLQGALTASLVIAVLHVLACTGSTARDGGPETEPDAGVDSACDHPGDICDAFGVASGQAQLACGTLDCGTHSVQREFVLTDSSYAALLGLPKGVGVAVRGPGGRVALYAPTAGGLQVIASHDAGFIALAPQPLSLALSPGGTISLAYLDGANPTSVRLSSEASAFAPEAVVTHTSISSVALAIDGSGEPHLTYIAGVDLHAAYRDGGGWTSTVIDTGVRGGIGFAIDPAANAHFLYFRWSTEDVVYARRTPAGVVREIAGESLGVPYPHLALALSKDGGVHGTWTGNTVQYGRRDPRGWTVDSIPRRPDISSTVGLVLRNDHPQIAFADFRFANYAVPVGDAGFTLQQLDARGPYGLTTIASDGTGKLHFATIERSQNGLSVTSFGEKYPEGFAGKFDSIAKALCAKALSCISDGGTNFSVVAGARSVRGNSPDSCQQAVRDALWTVTIDAGSVDACAGLVESATCGLTTNFLPPQPAAFAPSACAFPW